MNTQKRRIALLSLLAGFGGLSLVSWAAQEPAASEPKAPSKTVWTRLYNRKDLDGWHMEGENAKKEDWKASGEVLACVPGTGYLATDREYGDFELRLEFRLPPGGNSGVGLRFPRGGWPSTDGMEIQLLDDDAPKYRDLKPTHRCGSIYTFVAPSRKATRPAGQWNRLFIRCQGPKVVIHLNGIEIIHANLDAHTAKEGKGDLPLAQRPRKGLIGLQNHGHPIEFKRIEIREL